MLENRISADLTEEDMKEIESNIQKIKEKLPFLTELSDREVAIILKMGDKSKAFVEKTLEVAKKNPDILPESFDIEEMRKDVELFQKLYSLHQTLSGVLEKLEHTTMLVGSEAYAAALVIYNCALNSDGSTAEIDQFLDDLGKRYARKSKSEK